MARNKKNPAVKKDGASKKGNDLSLDEFSRLCDEAVAQAPKDNAANASSSKAADRLSTNPLITQQDRNPLPEALPRKSRFKNLAELKQWKLDQIAQEERSKQQQQQRMITYTDVDGRKYTMPAPSPDSDESSQPEERSYDQANTDIASSGTIQRCTTFTDLNDRTVGVQTLENALQIVIPNEDPHDKTVLARPARNDELVTLTSLSEETGEEGNMVFDGVLPSLGFNGDDMAEGAGAQSGYKCAATSSLPPRVQNQINDRSSIDEDEGHEDSELSYSTWANFDTLMIEASQGCDIQWFEWVMGFQTPFETPFKAFDCDNADFLMFGPQPAQEVEQDTDMGLTPEASINGGTSSKHEGAHIKIKSVEQLSQENQESASDIKEPPSVRCQGKMLPAVLKVTESKPSTLISTAPAASTTVSLDLKESALAQDGLRTVDESNEQIKAQIANDKMPEQMQPYYTHEPLVEEPELLQPHSIENAPISKPETSQSQSGKEPVSMASKEEQFEPTTPAVLEDFKRPTRNTANRKVEEWLQGHEAVMDSASAMPLLFEAQQSGFSEGSNDNSDEVDGSNGSLLSFGRVESLDQPEGEAQASIPGGKNVAFANQAATLPMAEREDEEVRQRANPSPPPPKHYRLEDFDYDKLVSNLLDQPVLPRVAKRKGRALSGDGNILLVQEWRNMARRWQTISWNDEL
ncbi:hypothetical protein UCRNP2_4506 [Neofusicoccum parvum UCRNP2]|uniref:Uncharacterized protein n=1 Tax=Botryosphaeria parva (strain UCR-NP2) TaxID=1287680 RepID=R1GK78_BOTPV|nr:hypothetical protein UCRNP2_4506 [Neofusicoccum parvum UCRNP2]